MSEIRPENGRDEEGQAEEIVETTSIATEAEGEGPVDPDLDSEDLVLPLDPEFLKDAPPEFRKVMAMFSQMQMSGPRGNPLTSAIAKHLNSDHLTAVIQLMDKSEDLEYEHAKQARWTNLLILVIVLIFSGFALWYLGVSNPDLLIVIVNAAVLIAGGLGAGFGYSTWRAQKNK